MHTTWLYIVRVVSDDEDPILLAKIILDISTPEDKDTMLPEHIRIQLPSDCSAIAISQKNGILYCKYVHTMYEQHAA
jgi:hypothetical protein